MFLGLGFISAFVVGWILKRLGLLRIPLEVEIAGLDHSTWVEETHQAKDLLDAERALAKHRGSPAQG